MDVLIYTVAQYISLSLDAIAILLVAFGAINALIGMGMAYGRQEMVGARVRGVFIDFARWLVAALTFQLGSDIVGTTVAPGWDELGRLAAVAGIRTFLTYFLDRDLEKAREEQRMQGEKPHGKSPPEMPAIRGEG